jgi:hypothetical protein
MVDVGGNDGSLLAALMKRHASLRGTLFDLPEAVAEAQRVFEQAGVAERSTIVAGNVFKGGIPKGADLYTIKRMLVGFSDEEALVALSKVRESMTPHSRLLIMEPMRTDKDQVGVSLDLRMLVLGLGRVRTPAEFTTLLANAGFTTTKTLSAGLLTLIETSLTDG